MHERERDAPRGTFTCAAVSIVEFLLARLAEDEALANQSIQVGDNGAGLISFGSPDAPGVLVLHPRRVLAEVEAKRRIVEGHTEREFFHPGGSQVMCRLDSDDWPCATLRILAAIYADHPDYDESWRP